MIRLVPAAVLSEVVLSHAWNIPSLQVRSQHSRPTSEYQHPSVPLLVFQCAGLEVPRTATSKRPHS